MPVVADLPSETAEIVGLELIAGDSWTLIVQFVALDEDNVETEHDLSGVTTWTGELEHAGGTIELTVGASDDPAQTLALGWVMLSAAAADTTALTAQRARLRLRATWGGFTPNQVRTLLVGEVLVVEEW